VPLPLPPGEGWGEGPTAATRVTSPPLSSPHPDPLPEGEGRRKWLVALVLALLVAVLYAQTGRFDSLDFDDQEYVYENGEVLDGLTGHGAAWAFTAFHSANWHPLTWLSHMLDVQIFGADPGAHHLVNAGLHAANAVLLFLVLRAATSAFWPSAIVAALSAVHPLNVESVAWISQRKSVLSTLFLFLALAAYVRWTRRGGNGRFVAVAALLALGLLAKPMLVSAPLLFLVFDFWPLERFGGSATARKLFLEKTPFFALAAGSSIVTAVAQARWGAVASAFPLGARVANALDAMVTYPGAAIWPARLACFYPHPASFGASTRPLAAISALALLLAITALAGTTRKSRPWLLFGWAWYLIALAPVAGIVQVGMQARADRYTYVPMIGIFVAVVWEIAERVRGRAAARMAAVSGTVLALVAFAALAFEQVGTWRNAETLYSHALGVTRNNWLAANNLGNAWLRQHDYEAALELFERAARIKPDYEQAFYNQGVALMNLSRPEEALEAYRKSLRLDPSNTDGWVNSGFVLLQLGRTSEGLKAYETALSQKPDDPLALYGAAAARAGLGDRGAALGYLARLDRADPARAADLRRRLGAAP
jgi:tetratricopeptide (TPR) repeat protein